MRRLGPVRDVVWVVRNTDNDRGMFSASVFVFPQPDTPSILGPYTKVKHTGRKTASSLNID